MVCNSTLYRLIAVTTRHTEDVLCSQCPALATLVKACSLLLSGDQHSLVVSTPVHNIVFHPTYALLGLHSFFAGETCFGYVVRLPGDPGATPEPLICELLCRKVFVHKFASPHSRQFSPAASTNPHRQYALKQSRVQRTIFSEYFTGLGLQQISNQSEWSTVHTRIAWGLRSARLLL